MHAAELAPPLRIARPTARTWAAILASVLGIWVVVMQVRLTGHALADIIGALGSSPDEAAWVNTAYVVAELVSIPLAGWLSMRVSARRVFVPAAVGFALASLAATQVTHVNQLIALRALQGFTGGPFIPMSTPTFRRKLPYRHRLIAFALFGIAMSVPVSVAPVIESLFVDDVSWRLLFVPAALLALAAAALAAWGMPIVPLDKTARWNDDWSGTLLLPVGLGLVVLGVDQANRLDWFDSAWVVSLVVAGALVLLAFLLHERRHARPYFHLDLLANRNFVLGLTCFLLFCASMIAVSWALPGFLLRIEDFRPSDFIDIFGAMVLPQLLLPFLILRAVRRIDLRLVVAAGVAMQALACLRLATLTSEWQAPELVTLCALHGTGQALFFTPALVLLTLNQAERQRAGAASLVNLTRVFGTAVGTSIASTYLTQREHLHHAMMVEYMRGDTAGAQAKLDAYRTLVAAHLGGDGSAARAATLASQSLRREAFVLAYGDLFLLIGAALLVTVVLLAALGPVSLAELRPRRAPAHPPA